MGDDSTLNRLRFLPLIVAVVASFAAAEVPGEADYRIFCAPCHGLDANGSGPGAGRLYPPPPPLRDPASRALPREEIRSVIREGGAPSGRSLAMPAFGSLLSEDRIAAIATYLGALPPLPPASPPPLPRLPSRAAALYLQYCSICHGVTGGGDGLVAPLLLPRPRPLLPLIRRARSEQIRHALLGSAWWAGKAMPPVGRNLSKGSLSLLVDALKPAAKSGTRVPVAKPPPTTGRELFLNLGCSGCHLVQGVSSPPRFAPDLTGVGERLRPSYLVDFLQHPVTVRPLGRPMMSFSRMPDYRIGREEARDIATALGAGRSERHRKGALPSLVIRSGCLACHTLKAPDFQSIDSRQLQSTPPIERTKLSAAKGRRREAQILEVPELFDGRGRAARSAVVHNEGGRIGPDLTKAGTRLTKAGVEAALSGSNLMPAFRFSANDRRRIVGELLGGAGRDRFRRADGARGARLIQDLGCRACHAYPGAAADRPAGPELTRAGERFQREFVDGYLAKPTRRRPTGQLRMPDFRLTLAERQRLVSFVMERRAVPRAMPPGLPPGKPLREEDVDEGRKLFGLLKCGDCHGLSGVPARKLEAVGPDLDGVASRLTPEGLVRWLLEPEVYAPGTKMPRFFELDGEPMTDDSYKQLGWVVSYLLTLGPADL